jgi:glycosyltransferase involved in cell wall biosynthesis
VSATPSPEVDLLLLSLGDTPGGRAADQKFAEMASEAGARVQVVGVRTGVTGGLDLGYPGRTLSEALAARRALRGALVRYSPRSVVFSGSAAALLAEDWLLPFAIWMDSPLAATHRGWLNAPITRREDRRLAAAQVLLPRSEGAAAALPEGSAPSIVMPMPVSLPPPRTMRSEPLVVAYVSDPARDGLELTCRAWALTRAPRAARLIVVGMSERAAGAFLIRHRISMPPAQLELGGQVSGEQLAELLAQARVFMTTGAEERFGTIPLEALAHGAVLAGPPTRGPSPALAITGDLAPWFVAPDRTPAVVATALEQALKANAHELSGYQNAVRERLRPYRERVLVKRMRDEVLPALLAGS